MMFRMGVGNKNVIRFSTASSDFVTCAVFPKPTHLTVTRRGSGGAGPGPLLHYTKVPEWPGITGWGRRFTSMFETAKIPSRPGIAVLVGREVGG